MTSPAHRAAMRQAVKEEKALDSRYSIGLEWCGYSLPRYVVRFCDDWVGQCLTHPSALALARQHNASRLEV